MNETKFLKTIYTFFLGLLLSVFIGFGVATFYPKPETPAFPEPAIFSDGADDDEFQREVQEYEQVYDRYQSKLQDYHQNVSIITLILAVGLVSISLVFNNRLKVIADGVLLGGLFTLIYSVGRSFAAENAAHSFVMLTIALAVVLFLGYTRFVKTSKK